MDYYSQYGQDKWLHENLFFDATFKKGTFLEIGADDGIDKSNTKFFEDLGWDGICIEPSPKRFKLLQQNRKCICENYAVYHQKGHAQFLDIEGWGKGLSGIVEDYDPKHTTRIQKELKHPNNQGSQYITVPTELLSNILDKNKITNIDFCSIDTEGSEYNIITNIDLNKYHIKAFVIENNYGDNKIKNYLELNGYKFITRLNIDDIYVKS
jgi:FkbM family methyltransferase